MWEGIKGQVTDEFASLVGFGGESTGSMGEKGVFRGRERPARQAVWVIPRVQDSQRTKLSPGRHCCRSEGTTVPGWRAPLSTQEPPRGVYPG